jgi:hypothetical protein
MHTDNVLNQPAHGQAGGIGRCGTGFGGFGVSEFF